MGEKCPTLSAMETSPWRERQTDRKTRGRTDGATPQGEGLGREGIKDPSEVSLERKTRQDWAATDALGRERRELKMASIFSVEVEVE